MNLSLIFDLLTIIAILVSAGLAFTRGFIREVMTIFGMAGGAVLAFLFGPTVQPFFADMFGAAPPDSETQPIVLGFIPADLAATATAYITVFIGVVILLSILTHFLSKTAGALGLGPVDRTLGVIFGLARGLVLVALVYIPFHFALDGDTKRDWFGSSKTHFYVESVAVWMSSLVNKDAVAETLNDGATTARDTLLKLDVLENGNMPADTLEPEVVPAQEDKAPAPAITQQDRHDMEQLIPAPAPSRNVNQ
ncbi:MAG: CvpA family protein [Pseudomonadota bacterium]